MSMSPTCAPAMGIARRRSARASWTLGTKERSMTRRNTPRGRATPAGRAFRRVGAPAGRARAVDTGGARRESPAMPLARVIMAVAGVALAAITLGDAFETIMVPRRIGRRVRLTRYFYIVTWRVWRSLA